MSTTSIIRVKYYHSPCGMLQLGSLDGRLCMCDWRIEPHHTRIVNRIGRRLNAEWVEKNDSTLLTACRQLDEYFARKRRCFDVPLLCVGSDFQQRVWNELLNINYGTTLSYGELARQLDCASAVRAVANANGANALSIFIPCHRVIGSDGWLTGYGGGLNTKRFLLALERS